MIDEKEIRSLAKKLPAACKPACTIAGDTAIVHSVAFILEVPVKQVAVPTWPGRELKNITEWRSLVVPAGVEGERAQIMRDKMPDDDEREVVVLMSSSLEQHAQVPIFEFVERHIEDAEFRLYPGEQESSAPWNIGVYSEGALRGVIAPVVKESKPGWKTETLAKP